MAIKLIVCHLLCCASASFHVNEEWHALITPKFDIFELFNFSNEILAMAHAYCIILPIDLQSFNAKNS